MPWQKVFRWIKLPPVQLNETSQLDLQPNQTSSLLDVQMDQSSSSLNNQSFDTSPRMEDEDGDDLNMSNHEEDEDDEEIDAAIDIFINIIFISCDQTIACPMW